MRQEIGVKFPNKYVLSVKFFQSYAASASVVALHCFPPDPGSTEEEASRTAEISFPSPSFPFNVDILGHHSVNMKYKKKNCRPYPTYTRVNTTIGAQRSSVMVPTNAFSFSD